MVKALEKLANFEIVLAKTMRAVEKGRLSADERNSLLHAVGEDLGTGPVTLRALPAALHLVRP